MPRTALIHPPEATTPTKARILRAAELVFAAKGFDGASTREIASAAGVNISSLHYHWESKETLYVAVFEHVSSRIVEVVRSAIPEHPGTRPERHVVDDAMGRLFDFLADEPTIPKLLVRRLLEAPAGTQAIERDILLPAWQRFATWTHELGQAVDETHTPLFMLTVHAVMLLFMLDSEQFAAVLGDSVRSPALRARVRPHIIGLVHLLIRADRRSLP
jgi:AcrR family transcriptional regulator